MTQKLRFPESDFITFGEVDYPDTGGDDEIVPEILMDTTDEPDEKKHDGEEEQAASPDAEDNIETGKFFVLKRANSNEFDNLQDVWVKASNKSDWNLE